MINTADNATQPQYHTALFLLRFKETNSSFTYIGGHWRHFQGTPAILFFCTAAAWFLSGGCFRSFIYVGFPQSSNNRADIEREINVTNGRTRSESVTAAMIFESVGNRDRKPRDSRWRGTRVRAYYWEIPRLQRGRARREAVHIARWSSNETAEFFFHFTSRRTAVTICLAFRFITQCYNVASGPLTTGQFR